MIKIITPKQASAELRELWFNIKRKDMESKDYVSLHRICAEIEAGTAKEENLLNCYRRHVNTKAEWALVERKGK